MHTHASSCRVEMMAIARHQPLTAWPPNHARKRPVKAQYTSATMLQMLAMHSTHANSAPQTPASACDAEVRHALEAALGRKYCSRFFPSVLIGLTLWACATYVLDSDGAALPVLFATPAPLIFLMGSRAR